MTIETLMTQIADDPVYSCDAVFGYLTRLLAVALNCLAEGCIRHLSPTELRAIGRVGKGRA